MLPFRLFLLSFLAGVVILVGAQSAIHEIEAGLYFLISAVFLTGCCVVDAIARLAKLIEKGNKK